MLQAASAVPDSRQQLFDIMKSALFRAVIDLSRSALYSSYAHFHVGVSNSMYVEVVALFLAKFL